MRLVASYYAGSANVGDAVCSPALYFDLGRPVETIRFGQPIPSCDAVIFGGGALGNRVARLAAPARVRIAWGLGETRHGRTEADPAPPGFALYGSRDDGQPGAEWVPCASCMSPLFDAPGKPQHEAVFYYNRRRPRPEISGLPEAHNEVTFGEAVAFLASGAVVVTNSYHGAYWAMLLGRGAVIVDAYSSKLRQFRHRPAYAAGLDWRAVAGAARRYPDALAECRAANVAFHRCVMDLLAA